MTRLEEIVRSLPPELQKEVEDFAQFLAQRRAKPKGRKLRQDWAGALKHLAGQYTALELQKKSLELRGD